MTNGTLVIKTPEGIVFSQTLAGPVTRFLAWFIDLLVIIVLGYALAQLLAVFGFLSPDIMNGVITVGYFAISIGYGIFMEWLWRGQTIGKKLFQLRVMDANGMRLQFDQVVSRNLLRSLDMLPAFYFVGGIACWFSRNCQRLGDIAANTIVIRNPVITEPDLDQVLAGKFNSLRQHPQLMARLRQHITPAEATMALQALLRRDEFDLNARVELFEQLSRHFQNKVELPPDTIEGISDEQIIRNVVDVVHTR